MIAQNKALGEEISQRVGALDRCWDDSALVAELEARMDARDLDGRPQDFQLAFKRHAMAARVKASNKGFNGAIKGFFTGGFSMVPAMSEMDLAMEEVQASWSAVQPAAIKHGVAP